MIYSLGNCSGAHFNPAVTLAILLSGRGVSDVEEAVQKEVAKVVAPLKEQLQKEAASRLEAEKALERAGVAVP